jgi:hypothetical protein
MTKTNKIVEQLRQMADEFRVKAHLAGMDAKDAWHKLEPKLHDFERKAGGVADAVADELVDAGQELKAELQQLLNKVDDDKKPGA